MDPNTTLAALGDNFGALGGLVGGFAKGAQDREQARALQEAGANVSAVANTREEQLRRQGRQTIGEQIAASAESGTGFGQTTKDAVLTSETNLSLDAMNARYQGIVERTDYDNKATALRAQASAEPVIGAFTGAMKAMNAMAMYGGSGFGSSLGGG